VSLPVGYQYDDGGERPHTPQECGNCGGVFWAEEGECPGCGWHPLEQDGVLSEQEGDE
jgi:hypothetical protein